MDGRNVETIGVRRTGWAALDREERQARAGAVSFYGRLFAGFAGRSYAVPFL
jgi:hypothetical protein